MNLILHTRFNPHSFQTDDTKRKFVTVNRIHFNLIEHQPQFETCFTSCDFMSKHSFRLTFKQPVQHYLMCLLMIELKRSKCFRCYFLKTILTNFSSSDNHPIKSDRLNLSDIRLYFQLSATLRYPLLKYWNYLICSLHLEHLKLEDCFSWSSTLGGAYASLGNHNEEFAMKARQISFVQMRIALRSENTYNVARCYVYLAYSLLQMKQLNRARRFLRQVLHPFISQNFNPIRDPHRYKILKNMYSSAQHSYRYSLSMKKKWNHISCKENNSDLVDSFVLV